jgi:hypothetical protein
MIYLCGLSCGDKNRICDFKKYRLYKSIGKSLNSQAVPIFLEKEKLLFSLIVISSQSSTKMF